MIIHQSSAEFERNGQLDHMLFGTPYSPMKEGWYICNEEVRKKWKEISMPIAKEDILKLNTWQVYKDDMTKLCYNGAIIAKDVMGSYWVGIGGTGWGTLWSVGLGTLESGKYPI